MENLELKKYRSDLTKKILQESDKAKRREILMIAKGTKEYQEAKILKLKKFSTKQETGVQMGALFQYAQEHYREYAIPDPEMLELINIINENSEIFYKEVLPSVSDELLDKVFSFLEGNLDEEIIIILKQVNFDYENLLVSQEDERTRATILLSAILLAQTYEVAVVENKDKEVDFSGFENDSDISDAKEFIYRVFGTELLQKCLISKVKYAPDKVNVQINGIDYWLPVDVYAEWESRMPEVKSRKFRAESVAGWNTDSRLSKKFIPTPINLYSFYGEKPDKLNYLDHVPVQGKMRQYKLGTIAHEVGHHIYHYLMDADKRKKWRDLVDRTRAITDYAKSYEEHEFKYDEFFAEAIRLKTTSPSYLQVNFPEVEKFLVDNFPEIKA